MHTGGGEKRGGGFFDRFRPAIIREQAQSDGVTRKGLAWRQREDRGEARETVSVQLAPVFPSSLPIRPGGAAEPIREKEEG